MPSHIFVCRGRVLYTHTHPHTYTHAQQYPQVVVERNYTLADSIESHWVFQLNRPSVAWRANIFTSAKWLECFVHWPLLSVVSICWAIREPYPPPSPPHSPRPASPAPAAATRRTFKFNLAFMCRCRLGPQLRDVVVLEHAPTDTHTRRQTSTWQTWRQAHTHIHTHQLGALGIHLNA